MAQSKEPHTARTRKNTNTDRSAERQQRIAEAAYHRAEMRGFAPGKDQEDWFEAELEIDAESADG